LRPLRYIGILVISLAGCAVDTRDAAVAGDDKAAVVQTAKQDLAKRLKVPERSIELVGPVEEVTWPDASLGCPEPGMLYAQVLTPGYRFKLQSGGKIFDYHAGGGAVKLCEP
jgi:hypothetical protein